MERKLVIKNYRNIGVDSSFELKLNPNFDIEKGGLVTLIGHNNVGKSNVLDALKAFSDDDNSQMNFGRDYPLFLNDHSKQPSISLIIKDRDIGEIFSNNVAINSASKSPNKSRGINDALINEAPDKEQSDFVTNLLNILLTYIYVDSNCSPKLNNLISRSLSSELNKKENKKFVQWLIKFTNSNGSYDKLDYENIKTLYNLLVSVEKQLDLKTQNLLNSSQSQDILEFYETNYSCSTYDKVAKYIGADPIPNIIDASIITDGKKNFIHNKDTLVWNFKQKETPDDVIPPFFESLFNHMGFDFNEVIVSYDKVKNHRLKKEYRNIEAKVNKSLKSIETEFNDFFSFDKSNTYTMEIVFQSDSISLNISLNGTDLDLDQTSSGFRWMFDFYFSFYPDAIRLKPGDIILIDDPCVYLHDSCISEFNNYLREFALNHHYTIVVATHRPAFVDVNHLEEVRIIKREGNQATIKNVFYKDDSDVEPDHDLLAYITEALCTNRTFLLDNVEQNVVFVEGPTDYYYLTAYKDYLIQNEIADELDKKFLFLPVGGVSGTTKIVDSIKKIDKVPFFLVDNDKGGNEFYTTNIKNQSIIVEKLDLIESGHSFKGIESVFDVFDQAQYDLTGGKNFSNCLNVCRLMKEGKLSDMTYRNFKIIFDRLKEIYKSVSIQVTHK